MREELKKHIALYDNERKRFILNEYSFFEEQENLKAAEILEEKAGRFPICYLPNYGFCLSEEGKILPPKKYADEGFVIIWYEELERTFNEIEFSIKNYINFMLIEEMSHHVNQKLMKLSKRVVDKLYSFLRKRDLKLFGDACLIQGIDETIAKNLARKFAKKYYGDEEQQKMSKFSDEKINEKHKTFSEILESLSEVSPKKGC
jgi:hypothetical protein